MEVLCQYCGFRGRIFDDLVPESGRTLPCPFCGAEILLMREDAADRAEGEAEEKQPLLPYTLSPTPEQAPIKPPHREKMRRAMPLALSLIGLFLLLCFVASSLFFDLGLAEKIPVLSPVKGTILRKRGENHAERGEFAEALTYFTRAIDLRPNYARGLNSRGNLYRELGRYDDALEDLDRAIEIAPEFGVAYYNRGLVYNDLEMFKKAIADYTKSLDLNPDDVPSLNNRGIAYGRIGEYEKAIDDFDNAIDGDPGYALLYFNRGLTRYLSGDLRKAVDDYTTAVKLEPDRPDFYFFRASAYVDLGRIEQALEDLQKACELGYEGACGMYEELKEREE
jgi:tetratricopeptide (TPR) repeat protein